MEFESEAAQVWAALLGLAFFIAVTVTAGVWLCIYHHEAQEIGPYATEPCTTFHLIWDDLPLPVH
jgi:hypothetical protein